LLRLLITMMRALLRPLITTMKNQLAFLTVRGLELQLLIFF
jgi:hypothetical protein